MSSSSSKGTTFMWYTDKHARKIPIHRKTYNLKGLLKCVYFCAYGKEYHVSVRGGGGGGAEDGVGAQGTSYSSCEFLNMGARNWAQTFWKNKHSYTEPPPVLILLSKQNWQHWLNSIYICFLYYYVLGWLIWSFYIQINQTLIISCINYIQYIQLNLLSDVLSRLLQHRHFGEGKMCPTLNLVILLTILLGQCDWD